MRGTTGLQNRSSIDKRKYLELFAGWSHIQLVCPQARFLIMQPQIRLANGIRAHLLARLLILAVCVCYGAIRYGMRNMDTLFTHFACECLCELADGRASSSVRGKLSATPECAQSPRENERLSTLDYDCENG